MNESSWEKTLLKIDKFVQEHVMTEPFRALEVKRLRKKEIHG